MEKEGRRFQQVHKEGGLTFRSEVWVDRETGVNYFFHADGNSGGMCVLVDAEGKPILTKSHENSRSL